MFLQKVFYVFFFLENKNRSRLKSAPVLFFTVSVYFSSVTKSTLAFLTFCWVNATSITSVILST